MPTGDADSVDGDDVTARIADASNVLLLAPSMSEVHAGGCFDLYDPESVPAAHVLGVSYTRPPDDWIEAWRKRVATTPADVVVVSVGSGQRSVAQATTVGDVTNTPIIPIESPEDLTGLGIAIGEQFEAWGDVPIVVCFDSLTVLLQFVELQRAFRFLHVLTGRITATDARAHFHLDPSTVDERTIATLTSLFDATVRAVDGDWQVRSR